MQRPPATLDLQHLVTQTDGDPALQRELLTLYAAQSREILNQIEEAGLQPAARADLVHKLAGSAKAIGAFAVAHQASAAEIRLRTGKSAADMLARLPAAVEAALAATRAYLAQLAEPTL